MTPLPHSSQLNSALERLVADAKRAKNRSVKDYASSSKLRYLYRQCNATDCVLDALDYTKARPSLQAPRSIIIQLPILILFSFRESALINLRRYIELILWNIYFDSHPVEWAEFGANTDVGYTRDLERPISFCAHREVGFYLAYAKELMRKEPSGLASDALEGIQKSIRELNGHAHGASLAKATHRISIFDRYTERELKYLNDEANKVFSNSVVALGAAHRKRFDKLGPAARAYFDYLIGGPMAKKLRSGPFGLAPIAS